MMESPYELNPSPNYKLIFSSHYKYGYKIQITGLAQGRWAVGRLNEKLALNTIYGELGPEAFLTFPQSTPKSKL